MVRNLPDLMAALADFALLVGLVTFLLKNAARPSLRWEVRQDGSGDYLLVVDINTILQRSATLARVSIEYQNEDGSLQQSCINDKLDSFTQQASPSDGPVVPITIDGEMVLHVTKEKLAETCKERLFKDGSLTFWFFIEDVHKNQSPPATRSPLNSFCLLAPETLRGRKQNRGVRMTEHFRDEVVRPNRRPSREGITYEMCVRIVEEDRYSNEQGSEKVFWGHAEELPGSTKWLKVVTDLPAEVLITAHKCRDFQRERERGKE